MAQITLNLSSNEDMIGFKSAGGKKLKDALHD